MKVYTTIGAGGSRTKQYEYEVRTALLSTSLGNVVTGDAIQINSGFSHPAIKLWQKDAETILEYAPNHPESEITVVDYPGISQFSTTGFRKIAKDGFDNSTNPCIFFLDHEPFQEVLDTRRFDASERPYRTAELEFAGRCMQTARIVSHAKTGKILPGSLWNCPGVARDNTDWAAVAELHKHCGSEYIFLNAYKQFPTMAENVSAINHTISEMKKHLGNNTRIIATITPMDLGTAGVFSNEDRNALLAKLFALKYAGIDEVLYWVNTDWGISPQGRKTITDHAEVFGSYIKNFI